MTTQSKSVLLPFLIIAGLLFAVALGWKFFGSSEDQPIVKSAQVPEDLMPVDEIEPVQVVTNTSQPTNTAVAVEPEPFLVSTQEEREQAQVAARSHMKLAMRYQTAAKALEGLKNFKEAGNKEMVRSIIEFMDKAYPNTDIPTEFLDY